MKLLREPALWFLLLGGVLFATARLAADPRVVEGTIQVTPALVEGLARGHEARTGKPPDSEILRALVEAWITDEALYREAQRRGLADGDPAVRRRLIQVMEFMAEDAVPPAATDAELADWLASHPADFRTPDRVAVEHLFFGADEAAARAALARLAAGEAAGGVGGQPFIHGLRFDASLDHLKSLLGQRFMEAVATADLGTWLGPVRSSYGLHLIRVNGRTPGGPAALADVRTAVVEAWRLDARARARDRLRAEVRARAQVEGL